MSVQVVPRVAVLVPLPDTNTAVLCVNPARRPPVQLTSQAGSTPRHRLLISFSMQVICTWLYTKYVHITKKCKTALLASQRLHISYVSVKEFFFVLFWAADCEQTDFLHFSGILIERKEISETHTVNSRQELRVKADFSYPDLNMLLIWSLCYTRNPRSTNRPRHHNAGFPPPERRGSWDLCVTSQSLPKCHR